MKRCLKCNAINTSKVRKATAAKRLAMNAPRYRMCDECLKLYFAAVDDDGFCSIICERETEKRGASMKEVRKKWLKIKW